MSFSCDSDDSVKHATSYIHQSGQIFSEGKTKCHGILTGIFYHVANDGRFNLDLWKPINSGDHVLYYTQEINAMKGYHYILPTQRIFIEPGLTLGIHAYQDSKAFLTYLNDNSYNAEGFYQLHEDISWQPGILLKSHLNFGQGAHRRPLLGVQITKQEGNLKFVHYKTI